jgi:hypothetical protein
LKFFIFKKKHKNIKSIFGDICKYLHNTNQNNNTLQVFSGFLCKNGTSTKHKTILKKIFNKINFFIYKNIQYLYTNYPNNSWIFDNIYTKKLNFQSLFDNLVNLLKPPFIIKSLLVSKKLKKKLKIKYTIKIVYKKDDKRIKSSLKQIYYNNNIYNDNKFEVRLYKSILYSLLEWKQSNLFKFKTMIFKNFFKS